MYNRPILHDVRMRMDDKRKKKQRIYFIWWSYRDLKLHYPDIPKLKTWF